MTGLEVWSLDVRHCSPLCAAPEIIDICVDGLFVTVRTDSPGLVSGLVSAGGKSATTADVAGIELLAGHANTAAVLRRPALYADVDLALLAI
jgi:hypothetical protein